MSEGEDADGCSGDLIAVVGFPIFVSSFLFPASFSSFSSLSSFVCSVEARSSKEECESEDDDIGEWCDRGSVGESLGTRIGDCDPVTLVFSSADCSFFSSFFVSVSFGNCELEEGAVFCLDEEEEEE